MKVNVFNEQNDLPLSETSVFPVVKSILTKEKKKTDEVNVYFVSTAKICALHDEFFNDPSPTDCITFPLDDEKIDGTPHILGEIFICPQTAKDYTQKSQGDVYEEVTLYLVHGLLHLLGYDDISDVDRKQMRLQEKKHLDSLKKGRKLIR